MRFRPSALAALLLTLPCAAHAASSCDTLIHALGNAITDVVCFPSTDLTTANPVTTPANNSIPTLPVGAFTPLTDRTVIAPDLANKTPITKAVPGVQLEARFADDPTGQARFVIRLPDDWNGKLVVAGASGTRSEYNGDFAWSDYVVQKGYAYASQNKGVLNLQITSLNSPTPPTPDSCRLNPSSTVWVKFYDTDAAKPFTQWTQYMIDAGKLAQRGVNAFYHHPAAETYAVGTSNGGYQVRRAIEEAPDVFDGGVDWEGTFIDPRGPNILIDLPPAIRNWPAYVASGFSASSPAAQAIMAAGYPPDIVSGSNSLWGLYSAAFWEVTQCQWQKRFDPTWVTYADGPNDITNTGGYDYAARVAQDASIFRQVAEVATTGKIKRPLITVAGTMDALLPIQRGARAYEALVNASRKGNNEHREAQYRLYEIQNGNHIETYRSIFPQLEFIEPHAQRAFDLLAEHVEHNAPLPDSQCVPRGGAIEGTPAQPGHCASLFVP